MKHLTKNSIGCIILALWVFYSSTPANAGQCTSCHLEETRFSSYHSPYVIGCEMCHGGNPAGDTKATAHLDMESYPGNLETVEKSCGQAQCHAELIPLVQNSIMNTVDGMISVTRKIYKDPHTEPEIISLGHRLSQTGADSYLRKLCVSCHLGSKRKNHQQSFKDRGGGCAACHLQTYPTKKILGSDQETPDNDFTGSDKIHPTLTLKINNDRCLGCHSRSGRISLNYLGLAEVEKLDKSRIDAFGYLPDNRLVEQKAPDVHSEAGMACIDCHTVNGLMGMGDRAKRQQDQTDIKCEDCHAANPQFESSDLLSPRETKYYGLYKQRLDIIHSEKNFTTIRKETPLLHIRSQKGERIMQSKVSGKQLPIPLVTTPLNHELPGHERLGCDSCHTGWAPQCYGCHVGFDPAETQKDHLLGKKTKGRWKESRWYVRSELPALGVTGSNKIATFVPGMNLTIQKTPESRSFDQLYFSSISAHTTQKKGRSCKSCHQNSSALGIIEKWVSAPQNQHWKTPIGWIKENSATPGKATQPGARSFNLQEIRKIRLVGQCLNCHAETDAIYPAFTNSLINILPVCKK